MKEVLIMLPDEEERKNLESLVRQVCADTVFYMTLDEDAAYDIAVRNSVDMFLLDIDLHPEKKGSQCSGADFAQRIRKVEKYWFTPIIYVIDRYDEKLNLINLVQCHGVFKRPYSMKKMRAAVRSALKYHTKDSLERTIIFQTEGMLVTVVVGEIIWACIKKKKMHVVTLDEEIVIAQKTCKALMKELNSESFVCCRRGTFVNLNYIKRIDLSRGCIYLKESKKVLEIGAAIKKEFLKKVRERSDYAWE